jgi:hypothetical protein
VLQLAENYWIDDAPSQQQELVLSLWTENQAQFTGA